jgi:hypothetical protein
MTSLHSESENAAPLKQDNQDTSANHKGEYGHSLSLLSLLDMLACPKGSGGFPVKTDLERRHLEALVSLWQSLGRPTSVFWRETRVYYERMLKP